MSLQEKDLGFIHLYTGNGKGKTTAAFGLALRAAGSGKKVFIAQFVKGMHYSELDVLPAIPAITLRQYGRGCFIDRVPEKADIEAAQKGLFEVESILTDLKNGRAQTKYEMVILDEACIALHFGLFSFETLKKVIEKRPAGVEVVITGRYAPVELIGWADLVTEMREIKHYYTQGVQARTGIEK